MLLPSAARAASLFVAPVVLTLPAVSSAKPLCRSDRRCHNTWVIPAGQTRTVAPSHPNAFAGVSRSSRYDAADCFYVDGEGLPAKNQPTLDDDTVLMRTRYTMALLNMHGGNRIELQLANFSQRPMRFTFVYFQYVDDHVGCPAGRRGSV